MINIKNLTISALCTIENALKVIDSGAVKIALVVDHRNQLLGTLTDGDIRRGLLRKKTLDDTIEDVYKTKPLTAHYNEPKEGLLRICADNKVSQLPIIDDKNKVVSLFVLDQVHIRKQYGNNVILMAGGLGSRLRPLTNEIPKPMLRIAGKPILQNIVEGFVAHGFTNFIMCLGYKPECIKDHFGDGKTFGASIDYIIEDKRMGTAGALTLLKKKLKKPFFVMNGDLLTDVNFAQMLDFHAENHSNATMCVHKYDVEVPFGVVHIDNENICSIEEKPVHSFFVNSGIYILDPDYVDLIPKNQFYDMPSLFQRIILEKGNVVSFPLTKYWMDIGRLSDYEKAKNEASWMS